MSTEIEVARTKIDPRTFDVAETIGRLLPRGHVIHGYSSALGTRMLMVLESRKYSDRAPLLGFGMDGKAELALARALLTYALREEAGLDYITEKQLPESTQAQVATGGHDSRFDNIVWGGDFSLYQDGDEIVAGSNYGGGYGLSPIEVRAPDPLAAIVLLAESYEFMSPRVSELPAISLK